MNLVEVGIGTTGEETVKLVITKEINNGIDEAPRVLPYFYKEKQIRVLALWCGAVTLLDMVGCDVDTLHMMMSVICKHRLQRAHHFGCCRVTIFAVGVV